MVVCLMRITARSRRIIGIFDGILFAFLLFLETFLVLVKVDKGSEFHTFGIFDYLWEHETLFVCSNAIVCILLLLSVFLLIFVFDVAVSQESDHFRVTWSDYSSSIYMIFVSLVLCVLSFSLSIRVSTEFDHKMTKLLMTSYLNYGKPAESRRLADRIHMEYSCCGVNSIEDFVDLSEVDKKLAPQTKLWPCNEWEYCGVPLSCCKSTSCSQKVSLLVKGWDPEVIMNKWFNKRGCVQEMDNSFLLFGFSERLLSHTLMILIIGFHIGGLVLHQILVSASVTLRGARLDYSKSSFAWLLNIGQPDPKGLCLMLNPELQAGDFEVSSQKQQQLETEKTEKVEEEDHALGLATGTRTETEIDVELDVGSTKPTDKTDGTSTGPTNVTASSSTSKLEKVTASSSNNDLLDPSPGNLIFPDLPVKESDKSPDHVEKAPKPAKKTGNHPKKLAQKQKGKALKTKTAKKGKQKASKASKKKSTVKKSTAPKKKPTAKPKKK